VLPFALSSSFSPLEMLLAGADGWFFISDFFVLSSLKVYGRAGCEVLLQNPQQESLLGGQAIKFLTFIPNEGLIVSVSSDSGVRVWSLSTFNIIGELPSSWTEYRVTAAYCPPSSISHYVYIATGAVDFWFCLFKRICMLLFVPLCLGIHITDNGEVNVFNTRDCALCPYSIKPADVGIFPDSFDEDFDEEECEVWTFERGIWVVMNIYINLMIIYGFTFYLITMAGAGRTLHT
jgi:WD40 repeat protein